MASLRANRLYAVALLCLAIFATGFAVSTLIGAPDGTPAPPADISVLDISTLPVPPESGGTTIELNM